MNFVKVGRLHPGGFYSPGSFPLFSKERKNKEAKKATNQNFKKFSFYITNSKKNFKSFCQIFLKIFLFFKKIKNTFQSQKEGFS
jgi:hypothetical protein